MGSWGYKTFEDDTALDWLGDFEKSPSIAIIQVVFDSGLEGDFIDDLSGPRMLAAAEVVAALNEKPCKRLQDASDWLAGLGSIDSELRDKALEAVTAVFEDSELREIWEDSDGLEAWEESINDLKRRLQ